MEIDSHTHGASRTGRDFPFVYTRSDAAVMYHMVPVCNELVRAHISAGLVVNYSYSTRRYQYMGLCRMESD